MGTYEINKTLSCFDDKRFVLNNGVHTLAYFHKDLKSRFSQMVINKKRFKKILTNGYKQKQMHINRGSIGGLIGVRVVGIVK